jgi:hypothetical protein
LNLVKEFLFEVGKEAFGDRIVPAIAAAAQAGAYPIVGEQSLLIPAGVLTPAIRRVNY